MDSWASASSRALTRRPFAETGQERDPSPAKRNGQHKKISFERLAPLAPVVRTESRAERLRRDGFEPRPNSKFVIQSIRRGSDGWSQVIKPFVSDLAFRSVVSRPFPGKIKFRSYTCMAAVLFVDISSYSKISAALADKGPHVLSTAVNEYLQRMLDIVQALGGDVLKFAGDAVLIVWAGSQEQLDLNVFCASKCALELQKKTGCHPIEGTNLVFRIHCGICCGPLESEVFQAPSATNMQRLFHSVGGDSLREIATLVDLAKSGEVCVSHQVATMLRQVGKFKELSPEDLKENPGATLLSDMMLDPETTERMDSYVTQVLSDRLFRRNLSIEEDFIHSSVLQLLKHGGLSPTQIAQMRNLCVLFIAMTSNGSPVNWLLEVQGVLDLCRCPIVQIIFDDKGVHIVAAVNLYETVPEAGVFGLNACRQLLEKRVGCAIGVAIGKTFCGVVGSSTVSCRWDITGQPPVRAARLMQYAIANNIALAVDESVYRSGHVVATMLELHEAEVRLKGTADPVPVFGLSASKIQSAFNLLETVHGNVHDDVVEEIRKVIVSRERSAILVTGMAFTGKKIVCQRAAGYADLVPFLHVSDETKGLLQLAKTVSLWFNYSLDDDIRYLSSNVTNDLERSQWSSAHEQCIRLVNKALSKGYKMCFVVDRVQFLDDFSLSLIRECLHNGKSENATGGKMSFLCVHLPFYDWHSAQHIVDDITRSQEQHSVPIFEVVEMNVEELKLLQNSLIGTHGDDRLLEITAKQCGYCAGFFFEMTAAMTKETTRLWAEGKPGLKHMQHNAKITIPVGMTRAVRHFPVSKANASVYMHLSQIYDELPPFFQLVVKVLAVAEYRGIFVPPRILVWQVSNDLVAEGIPVESFDGLLSSMEEMYLINVDKAKKCVKVRTPGICDIAVESSTPIQLKAIRRAVLDRMEEVSDSSFRFLARKAILYGELCYEKDVLRDAWKQARYSFEKQSSSWPSKLKHRVEEFMIEEMIEWDVNVESDNLHHALRRFSCGEQCAVSTNTAGLFLYMAPVAFGPLGDSLTILVEGIFREWTSMADKDTSLDDKHAQDASTASQRYLRQRDILESALSVSHPPSSENSIRQEDSVIQTVGSASNSIQDVLEKQGLYDEKLIFIIEDRLVRLRLWAKEILKQGNVSLVEKAPLPIQRAFMYMAHHDPNESKTDAVQHAMMILASMNWKPPRVKEQISLLHRQTVARLRNRLLRQQTHADKRLNRHVNQLEDFEVWLCTTALLAETVEFEQ